MKFSSFRPITGWSVICFSLACSAPSEDPDNNMSNSAAGTTNNTGGGGSSAIGVAGGSANPSGGGAANGTSGAATGGATVVGMSGAAQGGAAQGGMAQGGAAQGGVAQGGAAQGGEAQGGAAQGGEAQGGAAQGGAGNADDCGMPAPAPISTLITAAPDRYNHTANGRPAAVDLRVPTIMGKLIVDLGVDSGGIYGFGVDRGFHTFGGQIYHCPVHQGCPFPAGGEEFNTNCRWNTFDGQDHGGQTNMSPESSLTGQLKGALQELAVNAPGEGWEYFLDTNGNVRWGDVGFTGYSHGAQTAALIGVKQCIYRAVSRSGPRDNGCGTGAAGGDYDPNNPPWNADCSGCISTWLNDTPASPLSHLYGFVGKGDGQYGDIMFSMERLGYLGEPVNISNSDPGDSHRFYSDDGHSGFEGDQYFPALQKAWGVPQENMDYAAAN